MSDPGDQIDTLRDRIHDSEEISEADREAIIAFSDQLFLLQTEYSDYRHLKLLRHCPRMAEHVGGLAASLKNYEAAKEIVCWINRTYDNEGTNRAYRVALSLFENRSDLFEDAERFRDALRDSCH